MDNRKPGGEMVSRPSWWIEAWQGSCLMDPRLCRQVNLNDASDVDAFDAVA